MTSDDANALPLQTEGFANQAPSTTDRDERPESATPIIQGADQSNRVDSASLANSANPANSVDPFDPVAQVDRAAQVDQADQAGQTDQGNWIDQASQASQAEHDDPLQPEPPPQEPEIVPQPAPSRCSACGQSHWELYAHLPIETDAYLAAVTELNRRSRTTQTKGQHKAQKNKAQKNKAHENTQPPTAVTEDGDRNLSDLTPQDDSSLGNPSRSEVLFETEDFEVKDADTPISLTAYPHGTAWRCYHCGALSLVWPIDGEPIAETIDAPSRRRSSVEFRETIKHQLDHCLRVKATGLRPPLTLKRLRVLDLNLGRGTRAERNLALLHELGLAKHQIFGIGDERSTIERLNFAGYQAYYGTIDRVLEELPENHFDLVLGFNLVEYLPRPSATLRRLTTKLRPGARLLLELSNPESWQAQLFRHGYWASYQRDRRLLLGEKALRILGERCDFVIDCLKAYPEIQAWETSSAAWTRRKRHPLRGVLNSGLIRSTLVGIDRLRAALGMTASRYGAVLVFQATNTSSVSTLPPTLELDASMTPDLAPEFSPNSLDE